jgi:hypothetical protein
VAGEPATHEVQQLKLTGDALAGTFTLSFTNESDTYVTQPIGLDSTIEQVQAFINSGFAIPNAQFTVTAWTRDVLEVRFGGSLLGKNVATIAVETQPASGSVTLGVLQEGSTIEKGAVAAHDVVVDYFVGVPDSDGKATDLKVRTGSGANDFYQLAMDGESGALLRVSGQVKVDLFGFVYLDGGFAFEKSSADIKLSNGNDLSVDLLTIGATNAQIFAGLGGGTDKELGLKLTGGNFAFALMREKVTTNARRWTALQATAAQVSFVGVDGLTISGDTISVNVNRKASDDTVVDFVAKPLAIKTGANSTFTLNMAGIQLLQASGNLILDVFGFVRVSGSFAFEKSTADIKLSSGTDLTVDLLSVGATGVDLFAGLGGGTDKELGLKLTSGTFALALMREKVTSNARRWTALQASASQVSIVGVDGLTVSGDTISVKVNRKASDDTVVDFAAKPLAVKTGPSSTLTLDMAGVSLLQALGNLVLDVFGCL